jgi:hypothetical protein
MGGTRLLGRCSGLRRRPPARGDRAPMMSSALTLLLRFGPLAFVCLMDMQNLLSWSRRRVLECADEACDDYTIVVPLYGHPRYFDERHRIESYKPRVIVACDVGTEAMAAGADLLEAEGWRVFRCVFDRPTAPMLMKAVLDAGVVETTFTLRLDADTVLSPGLEHAVEAMRRDGADVASFKCHLLDPRTLCEKVQAQEYRMAMLSRHYRPWLLSGACYIARTWSLHRILERHTLWFLAEDSETGRIAFQLRMRIRHIDYEVLTAGPDTWRGLWNQRARIWWAGNFRHVWVNFDHNVMYMPAWLFYYAGLVWVGLSWKWSGFVSVIRYWPTGLTFLGLVFLLYTVLTYVSNWQVRSAYMLLIPYYSLAQAMLMPPMGCLAFARYAITRRRLGRYAFGHLRRAPLPPLRAGP